MPKRAPLLLVAITPSLLLAAAACDTTHGGGSGAGGTGGGATTSSTSTSATTSSTTSSTSSTSTTSSTSSTTSTSSTGGGVDAGTIGWDPALDESCGLCGPGEALYDGYCPGCESCPAPPEGGAMTCVGGTCAPRCPSGTILCGNTCANPNTDLAHCGSCGAACTTGLCVGGVCDPSLPRVLVPSGSFGPMAVDATSVFYVEKATSTIRRVEKTGGSPITLASGESGVGGLALDGTYLYWTSAPGAVKRVPKAGGAVQTVSTATVNPLGIDVDATHAYWVDQTDSTALRLVRAPLAGGSPSTLVTAGNGQQIWDVKRDSLYAYFSLPGSFGGYVGRLPADGSGPVEKVMLAPAPGPGTGAGLALDESYAYMGDDLYIGIVRRRKDQSTPQRKILSTIQNDITTIAVGKLFVYVTVPIILPTETPSGKALKCGGRWLPTPPPDPILPPPENPYGTPIVLDDDFVYTALNGQIIREPQ